MLFRSKMHEGLRIAAITRSIDPYDALISKTGASLDKLPWGAVIGTSSLRRKEQLKRYRSDFHIKDIRGNIEERLALLDKTENLDAIVIAACGLIRLELEHRITQKIPFDILKPHFLQGSLAIVVKRDQKELLNLLSILDARKKIIFLESVFQ